MQAARTNYFNTGILVLFDNLRTCLLTLVICRWAFSPPKKRFWQKTNLGDLDKLRRKERSGGSSVCRPESEDPHQRQQKLYTINKGLYVGSAGVYTLLRLKFPLVPMGVLACLTLRSAPHRHQRKFFSARVWGGRAQTNLKQFSDQFQAVLSNFCFKKRKKNKIDPMGDMVVPPN